MQLQSDTGRIVLTYYAKSVNIIAGGKGGGAVFNDKGAEEASAMSTSRISNKSLGEDLSPDGSFRIDGQRLYNLVYITTTLLIILQLMLKEKDFNSIHLLSVNSWEQVH